MHKSFHFCSTSQFDLPHIMAVVNLYVIIWCRMTIIRYSYVASLIPRSSVVNSEYQNTVVILHTARGTLLTEFIDIHGNTG